MTTSGPSTLNKVSCDTVTPPWVLSHSQKPYLWRSKALPWSPNELKISSPGFAARAAMSRRGAPSRVIVSPHVGATLRAHMGFVSKSASYVSLSG